MVTINAGLSLGLNSASEEVGNQYDKKVVNDFNIHDFIYFDINLNYIVPLSEFSNCLKRLFSKNSFAT